MVDRGDSPRPRRPRRCGSPRHTSRGGGRRRGARALGLRGIEVLLARAGEEIVIRAGRLVLRASLDELPLLEGIYGPQLGLLVAPVAGLPRPADLLEQV